MALNLDGIIARNESLGVGPSIKKGLDQAAPNSAGGNFGDVLKDAISEVNKLQTDSDDKIKSLIKGESQDIHGTVLAVQQADTSFKVMMQVRNKIMEAYKELSRSGM